MKTVDLLYHIQNGCTSTCVQASTNSSHTSCMNRQDHSMRTCIDRICRNFFARLFRTHILQESSERDMS